MDNRSEGVSRRELLLGAAALGGAAVLGSSFVAPRVALAESATPVELPKLPYEMNALEPAISAKTLEFHYGKHHKAYIDNTAKMIKGTPLDGQPLEKIVAEAWKDHDKNPGLFNNSAQAWNHTFYWHSLTPKGGAPEGKLKEKIDADFGGLDKLKAELADAAKGHFGSGWAWLVLDGGKLKVEKTGNAENPLVHGRTPLLTIDVWEHAYYLDYQNLRPKYVEAVLEKLDWSFAAKNMG
ncbi:MAG TPA: superoxide dismutase [Planctomycetota bacterium]|nr:superoxide dismutase [Planctomycetota bacterium]